MESPTATSDSGRLPVSISKGATRTMRPTAWTMPVNTAAGYSKKAEAISSADSPAACSAAGFPAAPPALPAGFPAAPPSSDFFIERHRGACKRRYGGADHNGVRGHVNLAAVAEQKRREDEPQAGAHVEPFRRRVIETDFEVRAESERKADERGVRGSGLDLRIAEHPWRHSEPQAEREARPVLPPGCRRHSA